MSTNLTLKYRIIIYILLEMRFLATFVRAMLARESQLESISSKSRPSVILLITRGYLHSRKKVPGASLAKPTYPPTHRRMDGWDRSIDRWIRKTHVENGEILQPDSLSRGASRFAITPNMQLPSKWISSHPPHPFPASPASPASALSTLEGGMYRALHSSSSLAVGSNSNLRKPPYPPTLTGVLLRLCNTNDANRIRPGQPAGNNCRSSARFPLPLAREFSRDNGTHAAQIFEHARVFNLKGC